jgi:hypothetical protein
MVIQTYSIVLVVVGTACVVYAGRKNRSVSVIKLFLIAIPCLLLGLLFGVTGEYSSQVVMALLTFTEARGVDGFGFKFIGLSYILLLGSVFLVAWRARDSGNASSNRSFERDA